MKDSGDLGNLEESVDVAVWTGGWHVGGGKERVSGSKRKFGRTLSAGTTSTIADEEDMFSTQSTSPEEESTPDKKRDHGLPTSQ